MKKVFIIVGIVIVLLLIKFGRGFMFYNKEYNEKNESVILSVKESTVTSKGAIFILKNNTDKEYWYGPEYTIERKENDKWVEVETPYPLTWNAIAYTLNAKEEKEINIDWSIGYGELESGEYRLKKSTFKEEDRPIDESKKLYLYAEFIVKKEE